jgi:hypothetical protein
MIVFSSYQAVPSLRPRSAKLGQFRREGGLVARISSFAASVGAGELKLKGPPDRPRVTPLSGARNVGMLLDLVVGVAGALAVIIPFEELAVSSVCRACYFRSVSRRAAPIP